MGYLLLFTIGMIVMASNVQAKVCTESEINELKSLASTLIISPELNTEGIGSYFIDFYNLDKSIYVVEKTNPSFRYVSEEDSNKLRVELIGVSENQTLNYDVYASDSECYAGELRTITLDLPRFNELSKSEICKDTPDLEQCKKTIDSKDPVVYEEVEKEVSSVIKEETRDSNVKYIFIGIIGVSLITGVYLYLRYKKNQDIKKRGII